LKQDKADKIVKKAELKAKKAAQQVQAAGKKAEAARKKQELQAQKKADRVQKKAAKAADNATKKAAKKTKKAEAVAKKAQLAAKKAEEKKAKAVAKAAAKAVGKAPKAEGEGGEGAAPPKKGKKKLLLLAVPVLAAAVAAGAFFFLRGNKEEEGPPQPIPAPAEYVLNEQHISALPVWGEVLVYREELQPPAEDDNGGEANAEDSGKAKDDEKAGDSGDAEDSGDGKENDAAGDSGEAGDEEAFQKVLYRYEGLQSPVELVSAYTALMTTEDAGFSTVDETLLRIDPPEFEGMTRGAVQLARNVPAAEDGTGGGVQSLLLSWEGNTCSVTLDMPEGSVHDPAPEPPAPAVQRGLPDLETMHPSQLGLPGDSMDAYELMPKEGSVRINNSVCMRVDIYDGNSQIAGSYFVSNDGRLYKLDETANAVTELDWE